jgi:hypothetical protein
VINVSSERRGTLRARLNLDPKGTGGSGDCPQFFSVVPRKQQEKTMCVIKILCVLLLGSTAGAAVPRPLAACLARHPHLTVNRLEAPFYLAILFTMSEKRDYVVVVRERQFGDNRLLVCMHDGKDIVLGGKGEKQPFSDMRNDNYMSSNWRVCTKKDVTELGQYYKDVPKPINQAICLTWEDAEALIYWDGEQFRWKSFWP